MGKVEALRQVADDLLDRRAIARVAGPYVMRDRPAGDHHHAHNHLHIPWPAVAAVAVFGDRRTVPREVRARQIVKHQVGLEVEQVAQLLIQRDFDAALVEVQVIERAIPTLQLLQIDAHAPLLFPARNVAAAVPVTSVIAFQPTGQRVFTGRPR